MPKNEQGAPDGVMTAISRADLDVQITTARAYPRDIKRFHAESMALACMNDEVAGECFFSLPRAEKNIDGPSVRLAEIVFSSWGNSRAGSRVIEEGREFIVAQGVFHDLERNTMVTMDVRRRITHKNGSRFNADMIGVTGAAACAIAFRNAIFKGIPKPYYDPIYQAARKMAIGDSTTLANKRADALVYLQKLGATEDQVLATLGVETVDDIGLDELATLRGLATAIKDGDATVEEAFMQEPAKPTGPKSDPVKDAVKGKLDAQDADADKDEEKTKALAEDDEAAPPKNRAEHQPDEDEQMIIQHIHERLQILKGDDYTDHLTEILKSVGARNLAECKFDELVKIRDGMNTEIAAAPPTDPEPDAAPDEPSESEESVKANLLRAIDAFQLTEDSVTSTASRQVGETVLDLDALTVPQLETLLESLS